MRWNSESGGRFSMNKSLYLGNADEDLGLEEGSGTIPKTTLFGGTKIMIRGGAPSDFLYIRRRTMVVAFIKKKKLSWAKIISCWQGKAFLIKINPDRSS